MITAGITIGPIIDSLTHTKKTRELWFASYMFSWYMEQFYTAFRQKGYKILFPFIGQTTHESLKDVGIYPDKLVFRAEGVKEKETYQVIEKTNKDIQTRLYDWINEISPDSRNLENNAKMTTAIINDYFQVKWFVKEGNVPMAEVNRILDAAEQTWHLTHHESSLPCDRCRSLPAVGKVVDKHDNRLEDGIYLCPVCMLKYNAKQIKDIRDKTGNSPFPSIEQISGAEVKKEMEKQAGNAPEIEDIEKSEQAILDKSPKYMSHFAVLTLDCDNTGKAIAEMNWEKLHELSACLFDFFVAAVEKISSYGGRVIYAGGDDVLALLPVRNKNKDEIKHLLTVISEIQIAFADKLKTIIEKYPDVGISIGVSVQYYKYPLRDALQTSREQLFGKAKQVDGKQRLCVSVRKHSGAAFELDIPIKQAEEYAELLSEAIKPDFLPHTIYSRLDELKVLLASMEKAQLKYFFDNHFNEPIHKINQPALHKLRDMMMDTVWKSGDVNTRVQEIMNYSNLLRFANLLRIDKPATQQQQQEEGA